ncbi:MAG TPA: acyl-CoA synthetase [Alphaproteobacteria bacterium]|jgi:predicted LPLAT superfamily acyltransferase|nr:acyl-CoA synthetase [Alphaproteobacteria bacterium]
MTDLPATGGARPEWLRRKERGSAWSIRLSVRLALALGRPVARLFVPIGALYFLLFSPEGRRASRDYLERALGRPPSLSDVFRHFQAFGACVLDRAYFLKHRTDLFDVRIIGEDLLIDLLKEKTGCLLLGAHIGSFEVLRAMGRAHPDLNVNMLMFEENAQKIGSVLGDIAPDLAKEIISLGRPDVFIRTSRVLEQGHFVGLLADRSLTADHQVRLPFLGAPAPFSLGAFRMMALLRKPVLLMVGLYLGGNRYDIHIERFAVPDDLPRRAGPSELALLAGRYAERLEHHCRAAPYNWFNFYKFWD